MAAKAKSDQKSNIGFRTPLRWMVQVLKKSRDNWKEKYMALRVRIKAMRTQIRDLERSRANWRTKAEALQMEVEALKKARRPQRHMPTAASPSAPKWSRA